MNDCALHQVGMFTGFAALFSLISQLSAAEEFSPEGLEFFEKRIRPVFVERCFKCHSAQSEKLKGGLRLDSREGLLKGGDTRPAVIPGHAEKSLLIEAVRYGNPDLQMPPKGKLSDEQVADLDAWVKMGAPWPKASGPSDRVGEKEFDLEQRRRTHWSWRPIRRPDPPQVFEANWARSQVDKFILDQLEKNGLRPAPEAEKRTLIRRLYFDLIGLPPAPQAVEEFLSDSSTDAYEKLVDQLLASPRFGERWARHWLDLVRYAETLGHEFDYPVHNAWRYRDYVIRAFNADVPYNDFVTEQIAGDLLQNPRYHPAEGFNESVIGTAFYWFGQQTHSPVDVRQHQAEVIENQIDVMTKTFLGLTVACARCHDHKFDAISTQDYYSLYGVLASSRYVQRAIDPPSAVAERIERLQSLKHQIRQAFGHGWAREAEQVGQYLLAARKVRRTSAEPQLEPEQLNRWIKALEHPSVNSPDHPMHFWMKLVTAQIIPSAQSIAEPWQALVQTEGLIDHRTEFTATPHTVFADFHSSNYMGWFLDGEAFGTVPSPAGEWIFADTSPPVAMLQSEPAAHSGTVSRRLQGALRSSTFTVTNRFVHLRVAGRESRINVFIDNFALIQAPIYGSLRHVINKEEFHWVTLDLSLWLGHRAYFEFSDISVPDLAGGGRTEGYAPNGYLAVSRVLFSDDKSPPKEPRPSALALLGESPIDSIEALADRYQKATADAVASWATDRFTNSDKCRAQLALLDWLVKHQLLDGCEVGHAAERPKNELAQLIDEFHQLESIIAPLARVPAMADGNGFDESVFIRGSPKNLGRSAPRRFLEAIDGRDRPTFGVGSGRLELARRITDSSNPFLARVMVNRVWHYLFARGLVSTPDDFGALGQPPTHPELLDWLADYYRGGARWSTKKLIRWLVTSSTYRMSSKPTNALAEEKDPNNLLLHRMPLRRLEGETIRDAILALSGRLDGSMFGPSAPIHLNEFMDGRGRPKNSGPLDGAGRRSIYVEVRRNFLSPMMRTFDAPVPLTTIGKRTVSNVPAQSLILMNDPFVLEQAQGWAKRLFARKGLTTEERVVALYLAAYSRPPTASEATEALLFLRTQGHSYGFGEPDWPRQEQLWADLCHVLLNVKEFVFLN